LREQIADGTAGTSQTLARMAELTRQAQLDPIVRTAALRLWPASGKPVEFGAQVRAWVRRNVRYVGEFYETLTPPDWMLHQMESGGRAFGDCDDMAMLAAALIACLGFPVRFTAVKPEGSGDYVHVFAEMNDGPNWYMVDPVARTLPAGAWDVLRLEV